MRFADPVIMENASLAADAYSDPIRLEQHDKCAIAIVWTGTPVGNFMLETCQDVGITLPDGTVDPDSLVNWITYTGSTQAAGGADGKFTWRLTSAPDRWARIFYDRTSGTGTANARVMAKGY